MKHIFYLFLFLFITSCDNEKLVQLPEITNSDITEILDVSPAYLFYDETKPDSLELNRKNLISTTNWLVNVDKRLTLDQIIPQITFLQNKKKNSSHKKKGVKNYYTCNNTSIKNLGFIEFTDVVYKTYKDEEGHESDVNSYDLDILIKSKDSILFDPFLYPKTQTNNNLIQNLRSKIEHLKTFSDEQSHEFDYISLNFSFNRNLTFQDYITFKEKLIGFNVENTRISNNEFIY